VSLAADAAMARSETRVEENAIDLFIYAAP